MSTEIYSKQSCQIKMVCQNLETIWLVIRFFSLVKNIVCCLWLVIRCFSLVKKVISVFPPFGAASKSGNVHNFRCFPWSTRSWFQGLQTSFQSNNLSKTQQNVALLKEFLTLKNESWLMEEIHPKELNAYISKFINTVRKKDNNEDYEPSSLRSLMARRIQHFCQKP